MGGMGRICNLCNLKMPSTRQSNMAAKSPNKMKVSKLVGKYLNWVKDFLLSTLILGGYLKLNLLLGQLNASKSFSNQPTGQKTATAPTNIWYVRIKCWHEHIKDHSSHADQFPKSKVPRPRNQLILIVAMLCARCTEKIAGILLLVFKAWGWCS